MVIVDGARKGQSAAPLTCQESLGHILLHISQMLTNVRGNSSHFLRSLGPRKSASTNESRSAMYSGARLDRTENQTKHRLTKYGPISASRDEVTPQSIPFIPSWGSQCHPTIAGRIIFPESLFWDTALDPAEHKLLAEERKGQESANLIDCNQTMRPDGRYPQRARQAAILGIPLTSAPCKVPAN